MRKLILITLLFAITGICRAADSLHLELYADSQKTGGARFSSPLFELRTACREEKYNAGIQVNSRNYFRQFPLELKIGNLSCSGSLSRLNSLELNNGSSPFSSSFIYAAGLSASLPSYSSFSKPESSFLQLSMNQLNKKNLSISINLWTSPENASPVFSSLISSKFLEKQLTLSTSWTAGKFFYEENSSNSWFLDSPFYNNDSHFCTLLQASADYKNKNSKKAFSSTFSTAIYESPFGPYTAACRTDFKTSIKQTEVYTSVFLNTYEDILTSSGKEEEPSLQIKTGIIKKKPILTKKSQFVFMKFGFNVWSRFNLIKEKHPLRINTGLQFSTDITSLSISFSGQGLLQSDSPEQAPKTLQKETAAFQIKNSWYLKSFTTSVTLNAEKKLNETEEEKDKVKYKIQLNLTNNANHKISAGTSFSFDENAGQLTEKKLSSSLTCRFNKKWLTIIGKLTASFPL